MTEAEILGRMIDRLQDKGWIQGVIWEEVFLPDLLFWDGSSALRSIKGKACLQGTAELCEASLHSDDLRSAIGDLLTAAISGLFPERMQGAHWDAVVKFNDHEDTTFEDVLLVTKHAREMADGD